MRVLIIAFALFLTGCSAFKARTYDPVEYSVAASIAADATHVVHRCDKQDSTDFAFFAQSLNRNSFYLVEYLQNKPDSLLVVRQAQELRTMTQQFFVTHTVRYCIHKMSNIQAASRMLARSLALDDKFDPCNSSVQTRYELFKASYSDGQISKSEFVELSNDLLRLSRIDASHCSLQNRKDMQDALDVIKAALTLL